MDRRRINREGELEGDDDLGQANQGAHGRRAGQ